MTMTFNYRGLMDAMGLVANVRCTPDDQTCNCANHQAMKRVINGIRREEAEKRRKRDNLLPLPEPLVTNAA